MRLTCCCMAGPVDWLYIFFVYLGMLTVTQGCCKHKVFAIIIVVLLGVLGYAIYLRQTQQPNICWTTILKSHTNTTWQLE